MNLFVNRRRVGACLVIGIALFGASMDSRAHEACLLSVTNFDAFNRGPGAQADEVVLTSPVFTPGLAWNELVVSWNAATNVALLIEVRPVIAGGSRFYSLGNWAAFPGPANPRTSLKGQDDEEASVHTDTLILKNPTAELQLRVTLRGPRSGLKRLAMAFTGPGESATNLHTIRKAWGRELPVPIRTQAEYPEGVDKWCSPTATTMLLAYWGEQLKRDDLLIAVPEVAQAVFDPGWPGTGNWPFNMAFAGAFSGINAVVARFENLTDLERWLAAGMPAAVSVSYAMLKGKPQAEPGDGHLVVVRGFTAEGDLIVNDPGVRRERVRRVIPRADFERAWEHSRRTVYLVWPAGHALPEGRVFPR